MTMIFRLQCDNCKFHEIRGFMLEQLYDYCLYLETDTSTYSNCPYYQKEEKL